MSGATEIVSFDGYFKNLILHLGDPSLIKKQNDIYDYKKTNLKIRKELGRIFGLNYKEILLPKLSQINPT